MADITNVNLLYLRKVRGIAPLSRFAVQDDGSLVASVPDEMEVRTLHMVRYDGRGRAQIRETVAVETLRRIEIGQGEGSGTIGVTDDDLYLFRQTRKSRFLPDRRASYVDIALNETGQRFATVFADMLASGNAVAVGDIAGRLLWTKDIPFPVTRLAVDRGGDHIAVVGETGDLLLLDTARNTVLRHRQDAPLRAVATAGPSRTVVGGGGGIGAVDSDGNLVWFTELLGEPVDVALDAAGRTTAVLLRLDDMTGRLVLLSTDGLPTWDIDFEDSRPTGLSLSPDGRYCAVTLRDGTLAVYELHYGERLASASGDQVRSEARTAREAGNYSAALELLRGRLQAVPSDVETCEALAEALTALRERAVSAAGAAAAVGDWAEADARLGDLTAADPMDADAIRSRRDLRTRWAASAREAGLRAIEAGNGAQAEALLLEAIAADPLDRAAREALADARHAAAEAAVTRGRALLSAGDHAGAITALTEAQARGASGPEVTGLLRDARVGEALALGNALYQDRQYAAALFQFKKVLRLDPENAEAQQKIGYSQNFLQDTQLNDRFTRLE
jgi:tetratricopeptide (TPR) repeat protein